MAACPAKPLAALGHHAVEQFGTAWKVVDQTDHHAGSDDAAVRVAGVKRRLATRARDQRADVLELAAPVTASRPFP